jgi:hypothetical protein
MRTLELLSANNPVAQMYNTNAVRNASILLEVEDYEEITPEEYEYLNNPTNENFMKWLASM